MPGAKRLPGFGRAQLPAWRYLGDESLTLDGADRQALTIPGDCSIIEIRAEGGEVYFNINGLATAASGGYIPSDGGEIIGPLANLASMTVFSTTASTVAHILYFVEA